MRILFGLIGLALVLAVVGLALFFPLFLLARRPVLRRLAVRNAVRRPRETVLVLLGSMLGTAIITSSFVVGDTLHASVLRSAFTQLGPADVAIITSGADPAPTTRALDDLPPASVDGTLSMVLLSAAVSTSGADALAEPNAQLLEVDFDAARLFGRDGAATGVEGNTPAPDTAVIGNDLATTLGVRPGDVVEAHAYGKTLSLTIDRVVPRLGIAGFALGRGSKSPNLFVAPGTIAGLQQGGVGAPPASVVALSAPGGVLAGGERAEALRETARRALGDHSAQVIAVKSELLDAAKAEGDQFTQLFSSIGFFSVLAGILLLVNIFVMLAQERKTELGMLRAVGLRRSALVGAFHLEGWLYAVGSSALGMVGGLALGRIIVAVATGIFASPGEMFSLELRYAPSVAGVVRGFLTGFLMSVVTVFLTSLWISRLNVIRAIRDLPEPDDEHQRTSRLVIGAVGLLIGALVTMRGFNAEAGVPLLAGPAIGAAGLVTLLRRFIPRRPLISVSAAAVLAWAVVAFEVVPGAFRDGGIEVFVVQGVTLTAAAVALVSQNQDVIGAAVRGIGGGSKSMSLRLGLAYPLARRFRTGMILTMYSLVVFTLTFITVFSHLFSSQIDNFTKRIAGGFDLTVASNSANPIPADEVRALPGVRAVAVVSQVFAEFRIDRTPDFEPWEAGAFDEVLVREGAIELERRDPRYPSDEAVYRAVLEDPSLIVVPAFFLTADRGGPPEAPPRPGDRVVIRDPLSGKTRDLRVAAISESGFGNRLPLMSERTLRELFGDRLSPNNLRVVVDRNVDDGAIARHINARFLGHGADARSYREIASENLAGQQSFFRLMQGYLSLGLVVGIAGLGVVMVRAVRERRRQIGILRSLGFEAGAVRRAFVAESAFVALEGIVIGAALALVTSWRLIGNGTFGGRLAFSIPWVPMLLLLVGTFVASLIATATPAQQASRIRPAVALRMTD